MIMSWTKWMERRISNSKYLIYLYDIYYKDIVRNEVKLAGIKDGDKILCIGGGSIPSTAIQIANQTKAEIHVIDIDGRAVCTAKDVVKKVGLGNRISIKKARGEDVDVRYYDVIHIALQVTPKDEVVQNIWNRSRLGAKIVVRLPKKGLSRFYSNLSDKFLDIDNIESEKISLKNKLNTMDDILLMIKG